MKPPFFPYRKMLLPLLASTLLSSTPAYGAGTDKSLTDYPQLITQSVAQAVFLEDALSNTLKILRDKNDGTLTQKDIDASRNDKIQQQRSSQISKVLRYDANNDLSVTRKEIEEHISGQFRHPSMNMERHIQRRIAQLMKMDIDEDGKITLKEMQTVSEQHMASFDRQLASMKELLTLDPNGDKKLTADELREIVPKAFALADTNGDRMLSGQEKQAVNEQVRRRSSPHHLPVTQKLAVPQGNELHVIGIYEGNEKTDGKVHGPQARIKVDRPGKKVTLLLTSYDRMKWLVEATDKTVIDQVIISSIQKLPSKVLVNGKERKADLIMERRIYAYKKDGRPFRNLLGMIEAMTGKKQIESFHGQYTAPQGGFIISGVSKDVDLRENRISALITPAQKLPNLTFNGALKGVPGRYTLSGKLVEPLLKNILGAVEVPSEKAYYDLTQKGLIRYDAKGKSEEIPASLDVPTFSWATGLAYDAHRNRIVVSSFGGEGYLYAYDLKDKQWSVLSSMENVDIQRLAYDPATHDYLGIGGHVGHYGKNIQILSYSSDGKRKGRLDIPVTKFPGFTDIYDPGNGPGPVVDVVAEEKYLIFTVGGARHGARRSGVQRVYLYDREKKTVYLTWAAGE